MKIQVTAGETDDPGFVEVLNSLVRGLISQHGPEELWIIQIDNWFDHKWLGFSGMGAIASNIPIDRYDTVKAESYQEKVTFPPFTPNRVLGQFSYVRVGNDYAELPLPSCPTAQSENGARRTSEGALKISVTLHFSYGTAPILLQTARQVSWFTELGLMDLSAGSQHSIGTRDGSCKQQRASAESMLNTCWKCVRRNC